MDRQKKQKFDRISTGHEAALIAMGVITAAKNKKETGPKCPPEFLAVMDKYRSLKFVQRDNGESLVLYPRDQIKWQDLVAYKNVTGESISLLDGELIMGIDAIFEGREDG